MEGACGCPIASKCLQHKQLSHFTGKAGRNDGSPGSSASIARRSLDTWSWRLEGGKTGHEPAPRVRPAKTGQPAPRLRRVRGSSRGSPIRAGQPVRGLSGGDPGESEPDPGGCARQEGQTLPEWLTQVGRTALQRHPPLADQLGQQAFAVVPPPSKLGVPSAYSYGRGGGQGSTACCGGSPSLVLSQSSSLAKQRRFPDLETILPSLLPAADLSL